jgi:hypothetical protein
MLQPLYGPEDLSLLGDVFDLVIWSLPLPMRTNHNRIQVAHRLMLELSGGERDPIELELAAADLMWGSFPGN